VYLTTAADALYARAIADEAACFAGTMASDGVVNLKACDKAFVLCGCFGERGFDYIGNDRADNAVWSHARHALVVGSTRLARETARLVPVVRHWEPAATGVLGHAREIVAAVRVHQWVKNLLVFVPIVAAHRIGEPRLWAEAMLAFASFAFVASGVYVQNDLADIVADRRHLYKRRRPFAAGTLSPLVGAAIVPLAYASGGLLALLLPPAFGMWLLAYLVLATAYTFWLKRVPIADVVVLAGLYALRVAAGGAATGIVLTSWLIAFSACLFLSLALVKREVELHGVRRRGLDRAEGRAYHLAHLRRVRIGGALAAIGAVVVLFIYVLHPDVMRLYRRPHLLWLGCAVLGAWLAHLWHRTAGGHVHDDPVVFALRDPWSYVASLAFALTIAAAA
jgi:4-hydroxybenzoate polyprenyltransferase